MGTARRDTPGILPIRGYLDDVKKVMRATSTLVAEHHREAYHAASTATLVGLRSSAIAKFRDELQNKKEL